MSRTILFLQACEVAQYPPIMNAMSILAARAWQVHALSMPISGGKLKFEAPPGVCIHHTAARASVFVSKKQFLSYAFQAFKLARRINPSVLFVSDPLVTPIAALLARLLKLKVVYQEHDSPSSEGELNALVRMGRRRLLERAEFLLFPNLERAQHWLNGKHRQRLRIIWNMPRLDELPQPQSRAECPPIRLYYHGSINPARLPMSIAELVRRLAPQVQLEFAGYTTNEHDYPERFTAVCPSAIRYLGEVPLRAQLLEHAARAHIGLAFMPLSSGDLNMQAMTGASNKAFDYMSVGLLLWVSPLADWQQMFEAPGYAMAVDPSDVDAMERALRALLAQPQQLLEIAKRNRAQISEHWHYEEPFSQFADELEALLRA
jgi:glycosyltransferase involved in cell wall biosynthesis